MLEPKRKESVYTRSLARAIEIAGGPEPLAQFLGCSRANTPARPDVARQEGTVPGHVPHS